jgi:hypothetical protein
LAKRLQQSRTNQTAPSQSDGDTTSGIAKGLKRARPWLDDKNLEVDVVLETIEFGHDAGSGECSEGAPQLDNTPALV